MKHLSFLHSSFFIFIFTTFTSLAAFANDGVFFAGGSQLVPIKETNIAITKEVLTISLQDDGYANVNVQYEFRNNGDEKVVTMGFESMAPYNDDKTLNKRSIHPYIKDFTAVMTTKPN